MSVHDLAVGELGEILSIRQVAKRAGWHYRKMLRYLVRLNEELGGILLVNVSGGKIKPRLTVSIAALRLVNPQWFLSPETLQKQIDEVREEGTTTRLRVARLERRVSAVESGRPVGTGESE